MAREPEQLETKTHPGWAVRPLKRLIVQVVDGPSAGERGEFEERVVSVGTAPGNQLIVNDRTVSRFHLELSRSEAGILVTDLGSRNGTFIKDVGIYKCLVQRGARLTLGATTIELLDGEVESIATGDFAVHVPGFVGQSEGHRLLLRDVKQLASSNCTLLIQGETGAGKEVVARAVHELSPRNDKAFVVVDCGSVPETFIGSELFGHEKGAFTGADRRRIGAFEQANGGTLFLDEIGELPLQLQPALLGVLERRRFRRVGGDQDVSVDVRVLSATHRDLRREVNAGRFREDLYYRLAVGRILVPPLRERTEDIAPLIRHFAREITGSDQENLFSAAALETIKGHRWDGNVRELRNFVESSLAMGRLAQVHRAQHEAAQDEQLIRYRDARAAALEQFEVDYLTKLISLSRGNVSEASRLAQMDRMYLGSLLRRHGLR